jgi:hypothetical protein
VRDRAAAPQHGGHGARRAGIDRRDDRDAGREIELDHLELLALVEVDRPGVDLLIRA